MTNTNVFQLSQPGAFADPLTEVLRNGARALLAQAVEVEVAALLSAHADNLTENGHHRLVRRYPPLAAVLRSGADPSSVSTGANTVICTGARDGRCDERS